MGTKNCCGDAFASYIGAGRRRKGLSRERLALLCKQLAPGLRGFSEASIRFWEGGVRQPSLAQFKVLAAALDFTPEETFYALSLAPSVAQQEVRTSSTLPDEVTAGAA